MAYSRICVVVLLLFLAFSLAPQGQVLAIQSSSSVLLVETVEWQPSSANLVLNGESNSRNRLLWTLIGAGAGAGLGLLVAGPVNPFSDNDNRLEVALGGAVLGALAGFILSGPSSGESSDLRQGLSVRAYIPAPHGIGLALDL